MYLNLPFRMKEIFCYGIIALGFLSSDVQASVLYSTPIELSTNHGMPLEISEKMTGEGGELYDSGFLYFKQRDFPSAVSRLNLVLSKYPASRSAEAAAFLIGESYFEYSPPQSPSPDASKALSAFEKAVRDYPRSSRVPFALHRMGEIYFQMGLLLESRGAYGRILKEFPSSSWNSKAIIGIARSYRQEEKWKEALLAYQRFFSRTDTTPEDVRNVIYETADTLFSLREFGEAQKYYEKGMEKWPSYLKSYPGSLFRYGETVFLNGEWTRAREAFFTLYNLYPEHDHAGLALNRVGDTYRLEGRVSRANKIYEEVLALYPKGEPPLLARIALGESKEKEALDLTDRPVDREFSYDAALAYFEEVTRARSPLSGDALLRIGRMLESREKFDEAIHVYEAFLQDPIPDQNGPYSAHQRDEAVRSAGSLIKMLVKGYQQRKNDVDLVVLYHSHRSLIQDFLRDIPLLTTVAEAHERVGLFRESIPIYQFILDNTTGEREKERILFIQGENYFLAGDDESAILTLGSYQSRYPKGKQNEKASQWIVQALHRKGDFNGVIATIVRDNGALNSAPDLGLIVSESYRKAGQPAKAREVLTNMLPRLSGQKTGVLTSAYIALGNLYYGDGAYQEAWEAYQKGLQSAPSMEDQEFIRLMMGRSFWKMGQKARAAEIFSELMKSPSETVKRVAAGWGKELPDETF